MTRPGRYPAEVRERAVPSGAPAPEPLALVVGGDQLDCCELRHDGGDAAEVGAAGRGRRRRAAGADDRGAGAIGIDTVLTPIQALQVNALAERLVGTIRRQCLDHLIVVNQRDLRGVPGAYIAYYNRQARIAPPVCGRRPVHRSCRRHRRETHSQPSQSRHPISGSAIPSPDTPRVARQSDPACNLLRARLTEARESARLTRREVGEKIGRPQSYVSKCERGERRVDGHLVLRVGRLADALVVMPEVGAHFHGVAQVLDRGRRDAMPPKRSADAAEEPVGPTSPRQTLRRALVLLDANSAQPCHR